MRGTIPGLVNPDPLSFSLPALYQGESFGERFLSVFDDLLAPILSTLETQSAYLDPNLTPPDFLPWLAGWVGLELDENWAEDQQRRMVAGAVALLQWRGTRRGTVELICSYLGIAEDQVEVVDSGGVTWSPTPNGPVPGTTPAHVKVTVRTPDPAQVDVKRLERLVADAVPAHVAHEVEVGAG